MNLKTLTFLSFWFIFRTSQGKLYCPESDEFSDADDLFRSKGYLQFRGNQRITLFDYLLKNTQLVESDVYGDFLKLQDHPEYMLRKIELDSFKLYPFLEREVDMLRYICKQNKNDYYKFSPCKSHAILTYHGCVSTEKEIYQFLERATWNFSDKEVLKVYQLLPPHDRAKVMLDIIDRVIELHNSGVVHSYIQPSNIVMKDSDFTEFRLTGLSFAKEEGKKFVMGNHGYLPPETYEITLEEMKVRYTNDVFALGMTFAEIEGGFDSWHDVIKKGCFKNPKQTSSCMTTINNGISKVFSSSKGLRSFLSVIKEAVSLYPKDRIKNMYELSDKLLKEFIQLKEAQIFISEFSKTQLPKTQLPKTQFPKTKSDKFTGYWRQNLATILASEEYLDSQAKKPSKRLVDWISGLVSGRSSKKDNIIV